MRTDFDWAHIQPAQDTLKWDKYDRFVQNVTSKGLNISAILDYGVAWASGNADTKYPPTDPQDFADFCTLVVERYAPMGVKFWEVWNEPNLTMFWKPTPDPVAYTELLKLAYPAIKAADPEAYVLLAGLTLTTTNEQNSSRTSANLYLQAIYDNGGKGYFDAVNYHPYGWSEPVFTAIRQVLIANGEPDKPLWVTEYGNPTGGTEGQQFVTEQEQANLAVAAVQRVKTLDHATRLFFYCYKDPVQLQPDREGYFGLRRGDGTARPSYDALKNVLNP